MKLSKTEILEKELQRLISSHTDLEGLRTWSSEASINIAQPYGEKYDEWELREKFFEEFEFDIRFRRKNLVTKNGLLKLSILQWFLPEEGGRIIHTLLNENIKRYNLHLDVDFQFYNQSKVICLMYLAEKYEKFNVLFGWLLQKETYFENSSKRQENSPLERILKTLPRKFFFRKPSVKKAQRKRGYTDHGSLGSEISQTLRDQQSDWSVTEVFRQKFEERQSFDDTISFLQGLLE